MKHVPIVVLDFGMSITHKFIARKLRESEFILKLFHIVSQLKILWQELQKGIILSGGPASVYAVDSYHPDSTIFDLGLPILGICYGMQLNCSTFWGRVVPAASHEYGKAKLELVAERIFLKILQVVKLFG